jgi:hypothetical protein
MAVVQISKIQVRRGQKNSNSGVPQLSSAEFAWAVDSQELFIGNGSVAEGAPYVGNTKILTEHDNILDLAASYTFSSTDTAITLSEPRSLQSKLDEYVSILDFIPKNLHVTVIQGSVDCVKYFETAFSQLFQSTDSRFKKVLTIPNGEYFFASDVRIPNSTIIRGETDLGVVLNMGNNNIRFVTETGIESPNDFTSTERPENIKISNLTIRRIGSQLTLTGIANSTFENVRFMGEYALDSSPSISLSTAPAAVYWENFIPGTKVDNILFKNCYFEGNSVCVKSRQRAIFDTTIKFDNCKFFVSHTAIYIDGVPTQGNRWEIYDCDFEEISNQAFNSTNGRGTIIQRSKFKNVGNDILAADSPTTAMVYFGEAVGNVLVDCISNRQQNTSIGLTNSNVAYSEVYNGSKVNFIDKNYMPIDRVDYFKPLAILSALNNYTVITYLLTIGEYSRYGSLTIVVGDDLSVGSNGSDVTITDSYTYSSRFVASEGGVIMTNFEFNVSKVSNSVRDDSSLDIENPTADTIVLSYKNPLQPAEQTGSISFDVTYGV